MSAEWILDNDAFTLSFTSTKARTVAEVHAFAGLAGNIGADGNASLLIDLDSVDSAIGIRDERMRELLFETSEYAVSEVRLAEGVERLREIAGLSSVSPAVPVTFLLVYEKSPGSSSPERR